MSEIIPNVVVSMPSQLFTMARSFKACSNGRIYIGKIDTDPTIPENQIQIYMERENGDLIPAPQPIIINAAGYPVYAGQIAKFVTVQGHSMAVYDSYGVQQFYYPNVLKYDPDQLRQDLVSGNGTELIGNGDQTLKQYLDKEHQERVDGWDKYIGSDTTTAQPAAYSGEKHFRPVNADGAKLKNYIFESPVVIDFASTSGAEPPLDGVVVKFGKEGLKSGDYFSQDNYHLKNLTIIGGTPEVVSFEPYTGLTAHIDNVRIINNGYNEKYSINFKGQNWWPTVSNCVFKDYTDKKGNFCKAIDDEGDESIRRSGNSRLLFKNNKCWWGGNSLGGTMLTASATFNIIRDNASEHGESAVILEYPSHYTVIDGLYLECAYGGGNQIIIGDKKIESSLDIMTIVGIDIRNVYFNNHGQASNRFIKSGNSSIQIKGLAIDNVNITNSVTTYPVIEIADVPGQSIQVGNIRSGGMPLINLTNSAVKIIDMGGNFVKSLNGNLSSSGEGSYTVASSRINVFGNFFLQSTGTASVSRYASGNQIQKNRMAEFYASVTPAVGNGNGFEWQSPNYNEIAGEIATVQFLCKASADISAIVLIKRKDKSFQVTLASYKVDIHGGDFREVTIAFHAPHTDDVASVLSVEIRLDDVDSPNEIFICAYRINRGDTGLCRSADDYKRKEIDFLIPLFDFY
ncbi:phage head-binding domain-containing protein [Xenorhabdus bovienii]|uniref:phage head-binding domain-containing protein n=2 Tax=Xenorhabdus bovienii TaxID=40576 RepID=UPI0023B25127|nr:phage head-binding domain-containing protein [Xenorhabdus bovienii]